MKKVKNSFSVIAIIWMLSMWPACSSNKKICEAGDTRNCSCTAASDPGMQICETDDTKFSPCVCGLKTAKPVALDRKELTSKTPKISLDNAPIVFELGNPIPLPEPRTKLGKPLLSALNARKSSRDFAADPLDRQTLGDLLWAAGGINRKDLGKRTTPSAMNWQEMQIYVALEQGLFVYDAAAHALIPKIGKDIRAQTGKQEFVGSAPINLLYVSDLSKMGDAPDDKKKLYAGAHGGFASQNVYLFCASEGLATVVRAYFDQVELAATMELKENQFISLAQTVGHMPKVFLAPQSQQK